MSTGTTAAATDGEKTRAIQSPHWKERKKRQKEIKRNNIISYKYIHTYKNNNKNEEDEETMCPVCPRSDIQTIKVWILHLFDEECITSYILSRKKKMIQYAFWTPLRVDRILSYTVAGLQPTQKRKEKKRFTRMSGNRRCRGCESKFIPPEKKKIENESKLREE